MRTFGDGNGGWNGHLGGSLRADPLCLQISAKKGVCRRMQNLQQTLFSVQLFAGADKGGEEPALHFAFF